MLKDSYEFRIVVIGAQNLDDVSTNGNLDTFVRISYGCKSYQSTTMRRSGRNPTWNYEMSLSGNSEHVVIGVYDSGVLRTKLIGECRIDFTNISSNDNRFSIQLTNPSKRNHICGTLLINLRFSKRCTQQSQSCPFNPQYGHTSALHVDPNCYCPVLCSQLRSCQPCTLIPIRPPQVQGLPGPLSRPSPVPIPVSVPALNHLMRAPGIHRSASANSVHSMGDSPRHRSSKSKSQFYQQDIRPNRRPPMYDKR
ncbi:hypothetical protein WA171_006045, partial [Blastocystis sp. BT1]